TCTFAVGVAGYYPFRILYFIGGIEAVNPTADNPSLEFFSINANGSQTLINDTTTPGYIAAYTAAATLPYIQAVNPTPASTGIPYNPDITATLVNGSITVTTNTINLWLNGAAVVPAITTVGGATTVSYQSANLPLNSSNLVQLAFTDSASNRRTNQWSFTVENILQQLWVIAPNSATNATWAEWVTSGSTERGLAYNPKTGHALLVSRSGIAGGPAGTGGVGIFDGNTGAFLGAMDVSQSANGVGTFHLNMIGVAEDGVIYACNLTTSAAVGFEIYRWQNESAPQQVIWNQNPLGGAVRCGDDFRVEGSGAGTQIIANGNTVVDTMPIFTTVDGTNFTGSAFTVSGLPILGSGNYFRLGLAFGCGNTFYGQNTGYPTVYGAYSPPALTNGVLLDKYPVVAFDGTLGIGPIGVDIANQRMIGDETSGGSGTTHAMNLYDLSSVTTTGTNSPIDHKTFATSTGSFGTGSVDFTPDGTRVYTLDTGNGIIAFSLAPNVAAPAICAQPQTNLLAGIGSVGFMDVRAIGAPQRYQWYFNTTSPSTLGTAILNATNRTLDVYNVQAAQLGFYKVVISNATLQTSATSSGALLDTMMGIATQPTSQSVDNGGTATFTVAATNGLAPYKYQWTLNGNNVGPNSATYTINNASSANAGNYVVIVSDALGQSVASAPFTLAINGAPQITSDIQPSSLVLPVGNTAVFSVSATGPGTLTYQWLRNGTSLATNSRITGTLSSSLTIANVQLSDSATYQLIVSNSTGYVYSSPAPLTVTLIGFNNGAGWSSNGNASINNGALSLTQGTPSQTSSAFLTEPVDVGAFRASWTYQDIGGGGADGTAFVLQNDPAGTAALGGGGGAIGFVGIANSVALEFNIYTSTANTVGMALDPGTAPVAGPYSTPGSVNIASGHPIGVSVQYLGSFLSVTLTDSVASVSFSTNIPVNITNVVGSNTAYVGFTGAAGGVASTQTVSGFFFTSLPSVQVQNAGGGTLVLTWPVGTPGFLLQQNSSLNNPANWVNATNVVTLVNGQYQATVKPTGSTEFYRLSSQ
ncbi:MAG TPA: immunoglobulin domain-containing protein, partial [Candidatus Saccharimonadales bacterium]|nr:immunoglobulin domain-containing protein [Candidatus Saccharimonadales bacterium]